MQNNMTEDSHILQEQIARLEKEKSLLQEQLSKSLEQKDSLQKHIDLLVEQRTSELELMNTDLQTAKLELEQYKNHLEEVIEERTLDLKTSEQRLISVSDSLSGGAIFEIKLSKDDIPWFGYLSKSIYDLAGIEVSDVQNNFPGFERTIHPEDINKFRQAFVLSKQNKSEFDVEIRFLQPNKPVKWLHLRANAIETSEDYTVWVGIMFDTTDKNKYQQEIKEREAILNAIIENIPYDFWALDSNNKCFLQNSASKRLWGDMIGETIELTSIPPKTMRLFESQINRVRNGEIINEETSLDDIHGNSTDFQSLLAPILLQDRVRGVLCINIDITDRKRVEIARIQNEQKFRNLFDNSTDAIIIQSADGIIFEMNDEFKKLINKTNNDPHFLSKLLKENEKERFFQKIQEIQNTSNFFIFETEFNIIDNETIPVEIKSKEVDYLESKAILSLIRNTTYRKKFERELVNTIIETEEKERARLAADLHDDIGPILSSMKMLTGLLRDSKNIEKSQIISNQIFELVTESIRSLRETSNSLSPHILKNYGIIAATRNIIQSIQHSVTINIETNCDQERFESTTEIIYYRVMRELLNNTIKHAEATEININLHKQNNILSFTYRDNGKGFNVEEKTKRSASGMGLYNIISRINSLEAKYSIDSTEGEGITFILETNIPITI